MKKSLNVWRVEDFNENGLAKIITKDDRHFWVDVTGKVVSEQAAHVEIMGDHEKYALVNKSGETVVPYGVYNNFDFSIMENHNGTAFVAELDGLVGIIDDKGEEIVPFGYYKHITQCCYLGLDEGYILPHEFGKNTYTALGNDMSRIINDKGEIISEKSASLMNFAVPASYLPILAPRVNENGLWGYVNKENELIIPYQFPYVQGFKNGFAILSDDSKFEETTIRHNGYHIDETGKQLHYRIEYDENGEIK